MKNLSCSHCGGGVSVEMEACPHCGIPLPPHHGTQRERHFTRWFIALVIFCFFMMFWLPPDWLSFRGK